MASYPELTEVVKKNLEQRGVLNQVKSRIRAEVYSAIDRPADSRPQVSNENILINELIREYLEFNKYQYTASVLKAGLRVRPVLPVAACEREKEEKRKEQKRAACKRWREAVKLDPIRHEELKQKDKERNRANRHRSKTEDEKARERELTRQRVARLRAKRKAEREAEVLVMTVQPVPRTTRAKEKKDTDVVRLQREKWAAYKRKERENWTSQRWRRHREKNLRAYHSRKETEKESGMAKEPLDREFLRTELNVVEDAPSRSVPLLYSIVSHYTQKGPATSSQQLKHCTAFLEQITKDADSDCGGPEDPMVVRGGPR